MARITVITVIDTVMIEGSAPENGTAALVSAVEAAVRNQLRQGEQDGFRHPLEDEVALTVVSVTAMVTAAEQDLLAALRALLAHEGEIEVSGIGTEHDSDALEEAKRIARAAIARAEGVSEV